MAEDYATIRDLLGGFRGDKIVEITQHDQQYFQENGIGFVDLMFESGNVLRIWSLHTDESLFTVNPDSDTPDELERN